MSGSWVTIRTVMPLLRLSSVSRSMISIERLAVEIAGRLVGEQHFGLGDDRAGDGDALLLAAGKLGRRMVPPVGEADLVERRHRRLRAASPCPRRDRASGSSTFSSALVRASRLKPWKTKPR